MYGLSVPINWFIDILIIVMYVPRWISTVLFTDLCILMLMIVIGGFKFLESFTIYFNVKISE